MTKFLFAVLWTIMGAACQTPGPALDPHRAPIAVYSAAEPHSLLNRGSSAEALRKSKEDLVALLKKESRNLPAMINLAEIYLIENNLEKAEATTREALAIDLKSPQARKVMAKIFLRRNQVNLAEITLNSLGEKQQDDADVLNLYALIAFSRNKPTESMAYFNQALKQEPTNAAVRMNLGTLYITYRQLNQAAIQFERILKDYPDHEDAKLHLAIVRSAMGNGEYGEQLYDEILSDQPEHPIALYNQALLDRKQQKFDDALTKLRRYLKTPLAQASNNEAVFSLMQLIRNEKQSLTGEGTSDEEIHELAASAANETSPDVEEVAPSKAKPPRAEVPAERKAAEPSPQQKRKPAAADSDIEMLQRELQR